MQNNSTEIPQATNLKTLMEILESEFARNRGIEGNVARLSKILESYRSNAQEWKDYALFDPAKYTRNLVDDGNGKYNLIIQCWSPGQESMVQNFSDSHCIFKILHGELTDTLYEAPTSSSTVPIAMNIKKESVHVANEVSYISNKIGLQNLCNKSNGPTVSLHLFSPPLNEAQIYSPKTSRSSSSGKFVLHSKYGELIGNKRRYSLNQSAFTHSNSYYNASNRISNTMKSVAEDL